MKQNDYFLNQMYNPEFSPGDFATVGLNSENTTIRDKDSYKDLDIVKNNPLFQTNGEFDESKLDQIYNKAMFGFQQMSETGSNDRLTSSYSAFRDDIFAKTGTKKQESETYITKIANPNKQTIGFVSSNIMEAPTKSVREVAEAEMVWNGEKWIDAPNDDTLGSFFNPKVMAQWDFDADINGNPTKDKDKIVYHKGEKKINPITGTYYYETLNGRSIYGRDVLSGWDTLTVDGSTLNKYDFFDSDDLEKSGTGSLLKAAVKVAPALIPGISPWYILARVGLSMADLSGKVIKMASGSENETASWLEGLNAAFTQSTSDYARGSNEMGIEAHAWGLENMLNLGSDVFTQIAEQRWIFKYGSSFLSGNGKLGFSKKAQEAFKTKKQQEIMQKIGRGESISEDETVVDLFAASAAEASAMLDNKLNTGIKFGEHLSKLYMTGITVADSYGEAKEAGLTDTEAAIFTLVYGLGEYGILSTNLGEHVLPELRAEKRRMQAALTKLAGVEQEAKKDTRKWYKRIMSNAKEAIIGDYNDAKVAAAYAKNSPVKAAALSVASNALGEGLEEVSEELWLDIAKSLQNAAASIGLTQSGNKMEAFDGWDLEKVASRYALNFVGGLIGGGIAVGLPGFQQGIKNMLGTDMSKQEAYQEVVALVRNGKKEELYKTIDKLEIADENQAASKPGQGTKDDNLNLANKKLLKGTVDMIEKLLTVHGADIDDHSVLKGISEDARGLIRFQTLLGTKEKEGSTILASYVQRFNSLATRMASLATDIEALENKNGDKAPNLTTEDQQQLSNLRTQLSQLQQQRDAYFNGEMAKVVMPKILFELSASLSTPYIATNFKDYVEKVEHRVMSEIPEERLKQLKQEWEDYKQGDYKDDFMQVYSYFDYINKRFSDKLQKFDENYFKNINDLAQNIGTTFIVTEDALRKPELSPEDVQQGATSYHLTGSIDQKNTAAQRTVSALYELASLVSNPVYRQELDILRNLPDTLEELKQGIISRGHSEEEADAIIASDFLPYLQQASRDFLGKEFEETDIAKIKRRGIQELGVDLLTNPNNSEEIKKILNNIRYMNQSTKDFLLGDFFKGFMSFNGENQDIIELYDEDDPELERLQSLQSEFSNIIKQKQISPIDELADEFQLAIGDESKPLSQIIKDLDILARQLANKNKIENFSIEESIEKQINHARQILNLLKVHVLASRKDGAKLGNLYGFNYVMNSLDPDLQLVEIDKEIADNILHDIAKTESRLIHYQNLFNINSGQKLAEQKKIKVRTDFNFIKKIKYIISILPESWQGKEKLEAVVTTTYNEMSKKTDDSKYDISQEQRNELQKESILLQDAIYNFFKENSTKLNEDGIYEIVSKLKLLPSTSEFSTTYNGTTINSQLNDFDDRTFLYMLASAASVKASDFYELMKTSIDPRYAPIPGQELAVKMSYGFLMNQPLFEVFGKAYNRKILEETEALVKEDSEYFRNNYGAIISKDSKLDSSYALQFIHTFLVEGGAGTGKSSGYYSTLINMLRKHKPDLLKKVWIVHTSEERANQLGKEIGLKEDEIVGYSREGYLRKIDPKYKAPIYQNGVIVEQEDNLIEDENTGIHYWKDVQIAQDLDNPTLIIFDESTRFSQQEMLVSEKYQSEFGIHGIATGDYDQIGAVGRVQKSNDDVIYLNTFSDNFFHSPKLGSSMRTENKIKDLNINNFKEAKSRIIKELRATGSISSKVDLKYYEDQTGLYGEKIEAKDSTTLDATIGLMLDSLQEGEQINYIADNKESDLYKKLQNLNENDSKYKGKIRFVDSSSAQGEEAQYYIVELSLQNLSSIEQANGKNDGIHENFVNTFYTAISRSKQGTLVIKNRNTDVITTNTKVDELIKSPLSKQAIVDYGNEFVQSLSEISGNPSDIEYVQIGKSRRKKINPQSQEQDDKEDLDQQASKLNTKKYPIRNDNPKEYHMLMHSMPVSETGFIKGSDGKYRKGDEKAYPYRIDGLNGLTQLGDLTSKKETFDLNSDGTLKDQKEALARLNSVTQAGLYMDNKEDIRKHVIEQLGLVIPEEEIGIDFMYMIKSTDEWTDSNGNVHTFDNSSKGIFNRMFKSIKEKLIGIFRGKNTPYNDNAGQNKYLAMNIYRVVKDSSGKEVRQNFLTVPLSIFTSPLTMLETEGFKELKDVFVNQASRDMQTMINLLQNDEDVKKLPNAEKLLKSLLIYTYKSMDGDIVVYLDDFIPARDALAISGPSITVSDSKGYKYYFTDEYQYDGEYVDLKDVDQSVHHISKDVYFATEDVLNSNGDPVIKKGHRFVLVSDITKYNNDKQMFDDFVKNELGNKPQGKISVIYVSAPKVSISDYFQNFVLQYKRARRGDEDQQKIDKSIGIETTDFRLSEFITKKDSPFDQYIKSLTQDDSNKTAMLARWEIFKNIITQIGQDAKTSEQLMDILNSSMAESKYLELIKVDDSVDQSIKDVINRVVHSYKNNKDITIKNFISNQLLNFIIKNNKGFPDTIQWTSTGELQLTDFIKENISTLEDCLPDKWKEGVYIRLQPKDESYQINVGENTFVPIRSNNYEAETDNVKVGNRNIRINGKIDTTVHVMEVSGLMDTILKTIESIRQGKNNYQLDWYVRNSRPHTKESPKKGIKVPESIKYVGENLQAIVDANEQKFKDVDFNSKEDLLKILNEIGYGFFYEDGMLEHIVKLPRNSQQLYKSNIVKNPDGTFSIVTGQNSILRLTAETLQIEFERAFGNNIQNIVKNFETFELADNLDLVIGKEKANLLKKAIEFVSAQKQGDKALLDRQTLLETIQNLDPAVLPYLNQYRIPGIEEFKNIQDFMDVAEMAMDLGYKYVFKEVTDNNNLKSIFDNIKKLSEEDIDNNSCNN